MVHPNLTCFPPSDENATAHFHLSDLYCIYVIFFFFYLWDFFQLQLGVSVVRYLIYYFRSDFLAMGSGGSDIQEALSVLLVRLPGTER